jgi:hypothetical protein
MRGACCVAGGVVVARVKGIVMAKRTKVESSVVVGAPVVADVAPVVASVPQEAHGTKTEKRSAKRAAKQVRSADGKPVHGLTDVQSALSAGYVYGTHALVRAQFKTAHHWFAFCAWRAEQEVQEYHTKAADAAANPEAYKRAQSGKAAKLADTNKQLLERIAQLEAMFAALSAQPQA